MSYAEARVNGCFACLRSFERRIMKDRVRGRKGKRTTIIKIQVRAFGLRTVAIRRRTRQSPSQQPRKRHNLTDVSPDSTRSHVSATIASPRVFPPPRVRERDAVDAHGRVIVSGSGRSRHTMEQESRYSMSIRLSLGDTKGTNDRGGWNSAR